MADTKISALTGIAGGTLADGDKLAVADASDLTASYSATMANVKTYLTAAGYVSVLARESSLISIVSNVTETTIFSNNIAANTMGTDRALRLTFNAARLNGSGVSETGPTFRLYVGGVEVFEDVCLALGNSTVWVPQWLQINLAMQGTSSTMHFAGISYSGLAVTAAATGIGDLAQAGNTSQAVAFGAAAGTTFLQDTTAQWALRATWQNGTNAATVEYRRHYAILELL
jgi:hypothetical protein